MSGLRASIAYPIARRVIWPAAMPVTRAMMRTYSRMAGLLPRSAYTSESQAGGAAGDAGDDGRQPPVAQERRDAVGGQEARESAEHDRDRDQLQSFGVAATDQVFDLRQPSREDAADQHPAEGAERGDPEDDQEGRRVMLSRVSGTAAASAPARAAISSYMIEPTPADSRAKA